MNVILGIIIFCVAASIGLSILGFGLSLIFAFLSIGWSLCSAVVNRLRFGTWDKPAVRD